MRIGRDFIFAVFSVISKLYAGQAPPTPEEGAEAGAEKDEL